MRIVFTERAKRDWENLEESVQRKLRRKLDFYLNSGKILKFAERLKDYSLGEYRLRIGDYRLIFDFHKDAIVILRVGHRKNIYR